MPPCYPTMIFGCSSSETRTNVNFYYSLGHWCSCATVPPPNPSISTLPDRSLIQVLVAEITIFFYSFSGFGLLSTSISSFYCCSLLQEKYSLSGRVSFIIENPMICSVALTVRFLDTSNPSTERFFLPFKSAFIPKS